MTIRKNFFLIKLCQSTIPKLEREVRFKSVVLLLWQPMSALCDSKLYWAAWAVSQYITH